jgi:hypothetical protein
MTQFNADMARPGNVSALRHFVITRLGLWVYSERWFARMIDMFEAVTLPSLVHQSSAAFDWLIVIDRDMPPNARNRIESLLRPYSNYHLVPIDVTQLLHVRQGAFDWVWEHCQDFIVERGLVEDLCDYVNTSLIDADDAWHEDVIATVNQFVSDKLPRVRLGEETRGTWIRHTCGMAVTFPRGHKWFIAANALEPMEHPFMSVGVFVAARFSSGISACSSRHRAWRWSCEVVAFEVSEIAADRPMWIYTRHDRTTQPWEPPATEPMKASIGCLLDKDFGIDLDKVQQWRENYCSQAGAEAVAAGHTGRDVGAQYDRVFKIAALNRQIKTLKRRQDEPSDARNVFLEATIARSESQRVSLIEELRAAGQSVNA